MLCLSLALYGGGYLKSAFFPRVNSDYVIGTVEMPQGGAFSDTRIMRDRMVTAAEDLKQYYNNQDRFAGSEAIDNVMGVASENKVDLMIQVSSASLDTEAMTRELRQSLGDMSAAKEVRFDYTIRDPGKPIKLLFAAERVEDLEALALDVKTSLARYPGVFDVSDSFDAPRDELVLSLKPAAESLGVTWLMWHDKCARHSSVKKFSGCLEAVRMFA